jgi:hypothetical protein
MPVEGRITADHLAIDILASPLDTLPAVALPIAGHIDQAAGYVAGQTCHWSLVLHHQALILCQDVPRVYQALAADHQRSVIY